MRKEKIIGMMAVTLATTLLAGCGAMPEAILGTIDTLARSAAGATSEVAEEATATPNSEPAEESTAQPTVQSTPQPTEQPVTLTPTGQVLSYDRIQGMEDHTITPYCPGDMEYFTMSKNGNWGVLRADGMQLFPCEEQPDPVEYANGFYWWKAVYSPEYAQRLEEIGAPPPGIETGYGRTIYFVDANSNTKEPFAKSQNYGSLENTEIEWEASRWYSCGYCDVSYDGVSPLYDGWTIPAGEPAPTQYLGYVFCKTDGTLLAGDEIFDDIGWFRDGETMAPVKKGDKWAYLGSNGELLTDYVYDSVSYWDAAHSDNGGVGVANNASGGYAAVCRDGGWGILDANGTEIVPCTYAGAVNRKGHVWLKEADGWHGYTLPGAVPYNRVPDAINVPGDVTPPDSILSGAERTTAIITADDGLVLRKAPGKEGAREDVVPRDVTVTVLGSNGADWLFVCYRDKFGWLNKEYTSAAEGGSTAAADPTSTYDAMLDVLMRVNISDEVPTGWGATLGDYDGDGLNELIVYEFNGHPAELWMFVDDTENGVVEHSASKAFETFDMLMPVTSKETGERLAASLGYYSAMEVYHVGRISAGGIEYIDSWSKDGSTENNPQMRNDAETGLKFEDCYTIENFNSWGPFSAPISEEDARAFLDGKQMQ